MQVAREVESTGEALPKTTTFRFSERDLDDLAELAEHMGLSRADVVRTLIQRERERLGLGRTAAKRLIEQLIGTYGPFAVLELVVDDSLGEVTISTTIDGEPAELRADLVETAHAASLRLEGENASLHLADISTGDAGVSFRFSLPLKALSPAMHRPR